MSDQELTRKSGFLDMIQPRDVILADRGFLIEDELILRGATLAIPAFTKGKLQLSRLEVEKSRQLAQIRIHAKRVIDALKVDMQYCSQGCPSPCLKERKVKILVLQL